MGEENLGSFHILFQGFGMLAWHCNWEASRQANAFAKVCHQVPVDIAWVHPMGATLGNCNQLMVLCPIQGNTFCQPPDGGSWQLAMAPKGQQCCCQGSAVTFFKGLIQNSQLLFKLPNPEPFSNCFFKPYLALPWNATLLEGVLFSRKTLFQGNTVLEGILSAMARKSFFKVGHQESLCICIPSYGL